EGLERAPGTSGGMLAEHTYRLVRDYVDLEPVEPLELKGKAERVPAYRLLAVHDAPAEAPERPPLVGREAESTAAAEALDRATADRVCERLLITGDAGVGKSRLVDHVCERATEHALVIRGRCLSYGEG